MNQDFKKLVEPIYQYQGWYILRVRPKTEYKIANWFSNFCIKLTNEMPVYLVPYKLNNKSKTGNITEKMLGYFFVKISENTFENFKQNFSSYQLMGYGIKDIQPIISYEVYKSMLNSGKLLIQYKIGDVVIKQDAKDGLKYTITEINNDIATLTTRIFSSDVTDYEKLENLIKPN